MKKLFFLLISIVQQGCACWPHLRESHMLPPNIHFVPLPPSNHCSRGFDMHSEKSEKPLPTTDQLKFAKLIQDNLDSQDPFYLRSFLLRINAFTMSSRMLKRRVLFKDPIMAIFNKQETEKQESINEPSLLTKNQVRYLKKKFFECIHKITVEYHTAEYQEKIKYPSLAIEFDDCALASIMSDSRFLEVLKSSTVLQNWSSKKSGSPIVKRSQSSPSAIVYSSNKKGYMSQEDDFLFEKKPFTLAKLAAIIIQKEIEHKQSDLDYLAYIWETVSFCFDEFNSTRLPICKTFFERIHTILRGCYNDENKQKEFAGHFSRLSLVLMMGHPLFIEVVKNSNVKYDSPKNGSPTVKRFNSAPEMNYHG